MTGSAPNRAEVQQALHEGGPVVALETTLVAHGFPPGVGVEVGRAAEAAVRAEGAVPATVGVLDGAVVVGLDDGELERFGEAGADARKAGPRDLAACVASGELGATTVGGTLAAARLAGHPVHGHRRDRRRPPRLRRAARRLRRPRRSSRAPGARRLLGIKSLLDVPATAELLETLGVPVLGYRTDELPLFYSAGGGPPVSARVETPTEAARIARGALGARRRGAAARARSPTTAIDVEPLIEEALAPRPRAGRPGQAVTPFVLSFLHERSDGRTLEVNRELIVANARLAARGRRGRSRLS